MWFNRSSAESPELSTMRRDTTVRADHRKRFHLHEVGMTAPVRNTFHPLKLALCHLDSVVLVRSLTDRKRPLQAFEFLPIAIGQIVEEFDAVSGHESHLSLLNHKFGRPDLL